MKKYFLLFACFSGLYAAAQDDKIIIVDRYQTAAKPTEERLPRRMVDLNQVFKFDPIRMAIGEINFAYERVVGQQTSIEFELGPTVSNLGGNRVFTDNMGGAPVTRYSEIGCFGSFAFKFYPLDGRPALNQLYVSPKFKYRRYNETVESTTIGSNKGYSNESIFTFNFGYQQWLAQRFSFDYYIGFGLKSERGVERYATTEIVGGEWSEVWRDQTLRSTRFVATIGIKVGIGN